MITASPSIAGNAAAVSIVALDPFGNTDTGYTGTVHLTVTLPGSAELRLPVTAVATARDAFGNIANGYTGTVHFTSSDPNADIPPNYTFVLGDGGVRDFTVAFDTLGVQTVTVTSTGGGPITGTSPATDAQSTMAQSTRQVTGRRPQLGRCRAPIVGFQLGGPVAVLPAAVNVATTAGGTATASLGTVNTKGSIVAVATGAGTLTVQTYPSSPLGQLSAGGTYYDVTIAPGNTFTQVVFTVCGVAAGRSVQWWNPLAQLNQRMSVQTGISGKGSCVTVTVTASTSPTLTQLVGTVITVPSTRGYTMAGADGAVFPFGDAGFFGSEAGSHLNKPIVGMAMTPDGQGHWLVASDGGIFISATPPTTARRAELA